MFFGVGDVYGDPVLNVQPSVNLAMFYPQIKAVIMSDYGDDAGQNYTFYDNSTITTALRKAVGTSSEYPYAFTVSRDALLTRAHTVRVEFSNNQRIGCNVVDGKVTSVDAGAKAEEPGSWAKDEVYRAISMGVVPMELQKGYTKEITRIQFAALAVQAYETLTGTTVEGRVTFTDTDDVNVQKLAYLGIVNGTDEERGLFSPNDKIERQQAAKIFCEQAAKLGHPLPDSLETPVFSDMNQVRPTR